MLRILTFSIALVLLAGFFLLNGCGGPVKGVDPKDTVIKLFGAMERDDRAAVAHLIDIKSLMGKNVDDYSLQTDDPRIFYNPEELLDDLTGEGLTKERWFSYQRIVGQTEMTGDSAKVEVSFINKTTNVQYYSKFGLVKQNDAWRIYTFRAAD